MAYNLGAVLSLKDSNFTSNMKKATGNIKTFQNQVNHTGNQIKRFHKSVTSSITGIVKSAAGLAVAYVGINAMVGYLKSSVTTAMESEKNMAQLGAVLKSTGGAAGMTKEGIMGVVDSLNSVTTFTKGAILQGENLLLTFTNVGKKVFPEASKTMLDMSTALGQDTTKSAMQLGKALNDPTRGMTALRRVGVAFTKDQEKQIKAMQKSGNVMGAQKMILAELNKEFGGSAEAAGKTMSGQLIIMQKQFKSIKGKIGTEIIPILKEFSGFVLDNMPLIQSVIGGVVGTFKMLTSFIKTNIMPTVKTAFGIIKTVAETAWGNLKNRFQQLLPTLQKGFNWLKEVGSKAFESIKQAIAKNQPNFEKVVIIINDIIGGFNNLKQNDALGMVKEKAEWLATQALPKVVDAVAQIVSKAVDFYNYIKENWSLIGPFVQGIAIAFVGYKTAIMAVETWTKLVAAAQWLWNAAMTANPIGLVITGIGLLIGAGILLYKNWDKVSTFLTKTWVSIKTAFKSGINTVIDNLNWFIAKINKIPGVNIPIIARMRVDSAPADLKKYARGGIANRPSIFGDAGPEMAIPLNNTPRSKALLNQTAQIIGAKGSGDTIFNITINGLNKSTKEIMNELVPQVKLCLANMS